MSKITLTSLVNLQNETTAVNAINSNNAVLTTAFDNTLSRDGTQPNTMGSSLDMNSNRILNLPAPASQTDPLRLQDVTSLTTTGIVQIANNTVAGNFSGVSAIPVGVSVTGTGNVVLATSPTISTPTISTPTLTGTPVAPTPSVADATTKIATTAFVGTAISNAIIGTVNPTITPQGRITLASGLPVMAANQAGATTVYFSPYGGNYIPIYNGAGYTTTLFTELSQLTTDTTKSPAAVAASSNYDLFVWNDAGTIRCTRGPAWTSGTNRGTGAGTTELQFVTGLFLNKNAITNGPAVNRGTYVGTIRSNASSTIDWIFGTSGSGGVAGVFNIWNAYNRVIVGCNVTDTNAGYIYNSLTMRQKDNSAGNQVSFVVGLAEDAVYVANTNFVTLAAVSGAFVSVAIGLDSITASSSSSTIQTPAAVAMFTGPTTQRTWNPGIGNHYVAALENSSGANTFNAAGGSSLDGLTFTFPM